MKSFVLILLLIIGISFVTDRWDVTGVEDISSSEYIHNADISDVCASSQENFMPSKNNINNNKVFDITNLYNFYTRLSDNYSRINNLLSEETIAFLKSQIKHKSLKDVSLIASPLQADSSKSLYKLLNQCDFYTYHNHRIII